MELAALPDDRGFRYVRYSQLQFYNRFIQIRITTLVGAVRLAAER